jgi:uncharacterized protein YbbK (DUF523 family)
MIRPKILVSACLEFERVRYNGQSIPSRIVADLVPYADFIKVCPEYEIGLGVPREALRIVKKDDEYRLIQHKTNRDVTDEMNAFSEKFLKDLKAVDGFIFKSKSPSMGVKGVKVYSGMKGSPVIERCGGFFAGRASELYKGYPIEEDDRLRNRKIRDHFLTKLYLFARYREALEKDELLDFHDKNILLLRYYNPGLADSLDISKDDYLEKIKQIMARPPGSDEIYSFYHELLGSDQEILKRYKDNKVSLETLKEVSKLLILDKKLLSQTFFSPYPDGLILESEDDRARDYWK